MSSTSAKKLYKTLYAKTAWISAKEFKPEPFDLLMLELIDGRRIPGWWTGTIWDGRRVNIEQEVVAFKHIFNI
jgi:hypothetical protein